MEKSKMKKNKQNYKIKNEFSDKIWRNKGKTE